MSFQILFFPPQNNNNNNSKQQSQPSSPDINMNRRKSKLIRKTSSYPESVQPRKKIKLSKKHSKDDLSQPQEAAPLTSEQEREFLEYTNSLLFKDFPYLQLQSLPSNMTSPNVNILLENFFLNYKRIVAHFPQFKNPPDINSLYNMLPGAKASQHELPTPLNQPPIQNPVNSIPNNTDHHNNRHNHNHNNIFCNQFSSNRQLLKKSASYDNHITNESFASKLSNNNDFPFCKNSVNTNNHLLVKRQHSEIKLPPLLQIKEDRIDASESLIQLKNILSSQKSSPDSQISCKSKKSFFDQSPNDKILNSHDSGDDEDERKMKIQFLLN